MHLTIEPGSVRPATRSVKAKCDHAPSNYAIGEINAYIAIRDELLAEAEEVKTSSKLASLAIANNFVETCLTPARSPYQAQYLPQTDAMRERQRCDEIKLRITDLREEIEVR